VGRGEPVDGFVEREPALVDPLGVAVRVIATSAGPPLLVGALRLAPARAFFPPRCLRGCSSGLALTTMAGRFPAAGGSASDSGGASDPRVTSVGSVTAAAKALPVTAAVAKMARPLLTSSSTSADSLANGIGGTCGLPKFVRNQ
jgi:hypothetical protein